MKIFVKILGCALVLGTFNNVQAMEDREFDDVFNRHHRFNKKPVIDMSEIDDRITAETNQGKAQQYLQLAKEYFKQLDQKVQDNILHGNRFKDKNINR